MDLNSPETWRWIWFVMAFVFLAGELATPAAFFFVPFAVGAFAASALAFLEVGVNIEWLVFAMVSGAVFLAFWPLGRRLERSDHQQEAVGASRWLGQEAQVVERIDEDGYGRVRLAREIWRAQSLTGAPVEIGTAVVVARLAGTRLIVVPVDEPPGGEPARPSDQGGSARSPAQGATQ